ncbi:MAG TPA: RNA polymerase sigma factor [Pyrinomonadaceae bacterium]|nr:RNA polymerase sigma factor [Pyrinomonadaceae bacterium]
MASPAKIARQTNSQEELFLTKYVRLCDWALKLTQNDRERAEDLVHDLYVQLVHARPNLDAITNLDAYLYRTLYNLNISQLRRRANKQVQSLSVVDFDSAESSLRAADPRELIRYQDDLRQVCHYAAIRKESSKAGSALILRFLHGYFPREIALVMKCTREAVEERLRLARNEARQFLQNPTQLRFLLKPAETSVPAPRTGFVQPVDQLLLELRQQVFESRRGTCLHVSELKQLYSPTGKLDHAKLSHLVSCPECLEETNQILDLPPLADRFPLDTIGIDQPPRSSNNKRTGGGGGDGDGGGAGAEEQIHKFRWRAQQVLEQRPQSLRISINGNVAAEQLVTSDSCTQILSLNNLQEIEFIEVLSGQQTLLLMISLMDQPLSGILHSGIAFSDDRRLDLSIDLDETSPRVEVVYRDRSAVSQAETASPRLVTASPPHLLATTLAGTISKVFQQLKTAFRFVLNPAAITATVALILITVLLFVRFSVPRVTAGELLDRATRVETTILENADLATHRTLSLETRRSDRAELIKQRVEIWHSAKLGKTSRRIYDAAGKLNNGEWSQTNGAATIYQPGRSPESRVSAELAGDAIIEAGEYWRLDLSARSFRALLKNSDSIVVTEEPTSYLLTFNANKPAVITHATLRIYKQPTRSVEQTLILTQNGVTSEVHFIETGFEQRSLDAVPQSAFEPDKEFGNTGASSRSPERDASKTVNTPEAVASVELEIEVTYLLNRIKANLGEQISVSRTPGGALRVEAVTETQSRKAEILQALEPVRHNPAVLIDVSTLAEAARRADTTSDTKKNIDREVEVADSSGPSDSELRTYFMSRVPPDAVDSEIRKFTQAVMSNSRQAVLRASALQKLVQRFSASDVQSLSSDAREKWSSMIREQIIGYQRAVAAVRNDLRRIYPAAGSTTAIASAGSIQEVSAQLLRISFRNDDVIRRAFTVAEGNSGSASFSVELWQSLAEAEQLARDIQRLTPN